ncbi:MAG: hypothetical protein IKK88_06045, partial [Oscillospiraceae bacterium]|nr:hypothetical protein [Oscillospiraceae bacterium]
IDQNGKCELTDLTILSLYHLGDKQIDDVELAIADVTEDDKVNLADLATLKEVVVSGSNA